jgi:hypothetical protein
MRRLARILFLSLLLAAPAAADQAGLQAFARSMGLRDVAGFVETVSSLRRSGQLPERYVTKDEAEDLGWRPGSDLCGVAPDGSIGGDWFGNRERRLPERQGRRWREADLDFDCGRRGAKRLVWSSDGLIYVTVDHYDSFVEVPP